MKQVKHWIIADFVKKGNFRSLQLQNGVSSTLLEWRFKKLVLIVAFYVCFNFYHLTIIGGDKDNQSFYDLPIVMILHRLANQFTRTDQIRIRYLIRIWSNDWSFVQHGWYKNGRDLVRNIRTYASRSRIRYLIRIWSDIWRFRNNRFWHHFSFVFMTWSSTLLGKNSIDAFLSLIFFNLLEHFEASPIFSKFLQSSPIYFLL